MIFNGNKLSYEGERVYWRHGTLRGRRVACHTVGVIDTQRRRLLTDINVCMSRARSVLWVGESDGPDSLDHLPQLPQSYSGLSCVILSVDLLHLQPQIHHRLVKHPQHVPS